MMIIDIDTPTSLREFADALDKDRGHSKSYVTIIMREAANEIEKMRELLDECWNTIAATRQPDDAKAVEENHLLEEVEKFLVKK
jgi:hypothetical protein